MAENDNWINPPQDFLDRLSALPVDIRPVSDAKLLMGGLKSKTADAVGRIYYVQIVKWLDDSSVEVNHSLYGGPLYGGGITGAVYVLLDGEWSLKKEGQHHIS